MNVLKSSRCHKQDVERCSAFVLQVLRHNGWCQGLTRAVCKRNKGGEFLYAKTDKEAHELWTARKEALWSMLWLRREGDQVWSTDVAVPILRLADIIDETKADLSSLGLFASLAGQIGDGNFHTSIMSGDAAEKEHVEQIVHEMADTALESEGTCGVKIALISERKRLFTVNLVANPSR